MTDDVQTCLNCGETKRVKSDLPDEVRVRAVKAAKAASHGYSAEALNSLLSWRDVVDAVHRVLSEHEQSRVHELERELDAAGEEVRNLEKARDGLQDRIGYVEEWRDDFRDKFDAMRRNRDDTCKRVEKLQAENEQLKQEARDAAKSHNQVTAKLIRENENLRTQSRDLDRELRAGETISDLRKQWNDIATRGIRADDALSQVTVVWLSACKRVEKLEAANELLNEQIVGWKLRDAEFQAVVQQRDELQRQLDRVREALGEAD